MRAMAVTTAQKTRFVRLLVIVLLLAVAICSVFAVLLRPNGLVASLIRATHLTWPRPAIFGTYHLIMLGLCLALVVAIALLYPRFPRERLDGLLFSVGVALFILELYKQLYDLVVLSGGRYNFGILPFQLCSYALYAYLLIPLLPEGRFKEALLDFVGLYLTIGGAVVLGYPTLYAEVALSLHTLLWHMLMIAVGVLVLLVRGYGRPYLKTMLSATSVLLVTTGLAMVLNVVLTPLAADSPKPLNLFYISPYIQSHYWLIGDVQRDFGWFWSVVVYVLMLVLIGANVVWGIGRGIKVLHKDC